MNSAPTGSCPNGGITVYAGIDTNGNGVLDQSEIKSTQYVCNGANGSNGINALVSTIVEDPGANCAYGGFKVNAGLDTNGNGLLDTSEITGTRYVCNGTNGTNGTNGYSTLVSIVTDTTYCTNNGGLRITSGLDNGAGGGTANDNILEQGEVTSTSYLCNGTNGSNGYNSLVNIVSEPAGANCTYSGQKIMSGLDDGTNGGTANDGILESGEVTSTEYVCNGAGINWVDVTTTSVLAVSNTGYLADSPSRVTITLPASPALGDIIQVTGVGTGGWKIAQNNGQSIMTKDLSGDIIENWRPYATNERWKSVAASSDGTKLAAVTAGSPTENGLIYTSIDSGATWTSSMPASWSSIASSADGTKLFALGSSGFYISTDSGISWAIQNYPLPISISFFASSWNGYTLIASDYFFNLVAISTDLGSTWTTKSLPITLTCSVAESSDGYTLFVAGQDNPTLTGDNYFVIYKSTDLGNSWTKEAADMKWGGCPHIAVSADGTRLVAAVTSGQIFTSNDSGLTWSAHATSQQWESVAISADGLKMAAGVYGGQVYVSEDSGATWAAYGIIQSWDSIAIASDGRMLIAAGNSGPSSSGGLLPGQLVISTPNTTTTPGPAGYISGGQYDAIELQYVGNNIFDMLSHEGYLVVQ